MKRLALSLALIATLSLGIACNSNKKNEQASTTENTATGSETQRAAAGDTKVDKDKINNALTASDLGAVTVKVDDDKKVVSLSGEVASVDQKQQAEQIAKDNAAGYVVANEVAVNPANNTHDAKKVSGNLDDSIKSQFKALVAQNNWDNQNIKSNVKNGVLTLKGDVDTQSQSMAIQKAAASIPHVKQVVNEMTAKDASK